MRARVVGVGAVLSNESSSEVNYLRTFLRSKNIPYTDKTNRDDYVVIYVNENYIGKLPKNRFGTYLPTSDTDGPVIYEIYNIDIM